MKYISIIIFIILVNCGVLLSAPSGVYYINWVDGVYGLQIVNITTGQVSPSNDLTSISDQYILQNFLDFDKNGNSIIFAETINPPGRVVLLTLSNKGELLSQSKLVFRITSDFEWFSTSVKYDAVNQIVYIGGLGSYSNIIETYDFIHAKAYVTNVTMPDQYAVTCAFDSTSEEYYMLDPNYSFNNFTLYTFNTQSNSLSTGVKVQGLPASASPYAFFTNSQLYVANFNLNTGENLTIYSIDLVTGKANFICSLDQAAISNYINFYSIDNYFAIITAESNASYVILIDLNTGVVQSNNELLGSPLLVMQMVSFITYY